MAIGRIGDYVPGSGRKLVRLNDGTIVKRREAENRNARALGARNEYEAKQARRSARDSGLYGSDQYRTDREAARNAGRLTDKEFQTMAAITAYQGKNGTLDKGPGSPLAYYLWSIGRRSTPFDYAVGETPTV